MLGGRPWRFVVREALTTANYRSAARIARVALDPLDFARRYFLGGGEYPVVRCRLRTPLGTIAPLVYLHTDVWTLNEVFCRLDYELPAGASVVVDVGSNIGLSALYFLTRGPEVRCHLFEPDPRNVERLLVNLAGFNRRFELSECAVGDLSGVVQFSREPAGRYGSIGAAGSDCIEV